MKMSVWGSGGVWAWGSWWVVKSKQNRQHRKSICRSGGVLCKWLVGRVIGVIGLTITLPFFTPSKIIFVYSFFKVSFIPPKKIYLLYPIYYVIYKINHSNSHALLRLNLNK